MTDSFLKSIARYYSDGNAARPAAEDIVFVLPNKRSQLFLKNSYCSLLSELASAGGAQAVRMPRFLTVQQLIGNLAGTPVADSRELIFILYKAYLKVIPPSQKVRDFESFVFWGNIILSDFDDVDRAMVRADELFTNLLRLNEIKAFYLNERQIKAIESVWGESTLFIDRSEESDLSGFWKHVEHEEGGGKTLHREFVQFWEILSRLYDAYHAELKALGATSPGMQFRIAADNVMELCAEDIGRKHYVFVGFNDLSHAETVIFSRLKELGVASFFWDTAPLSMFGGDDKAVAVGAPMERLRRLALSFPMPADYMLPAADGLPEITVEAVPSNIAQPKALHNLLEKNIEDYKINDEDALTTAVVLPDAGLLLPTLMSIPATIRDVNITMGLSYRSTTFAAMLHAIVRMHLNSRPVGGGGVSFFYQDVLNLLSQPHIRQVARQEARRLSDKIASGGMIRIDSKAIQEDAGVLGMFFEPVANYSTVGEVTGYLINMLGNLRQVLEDFSLRATGDDAEGGERKATLKLFETEAIAYFRNEIIEVDKLLAKYEIDLSGKRAARAVFRIFERLFNHRGLSVNGTPVRGLQVLGVLETRSLDFDNVAVLSMNESVFPRVNYTRTMIPAALRTFFHLPDFQSLEWTYAYCFYRLVARARNVTLFYDSRNDGQGNGEESRYIRQLANLVPGLKITEKRATFTTKELSTEEICLAKDDLVAGQIEKLLYDPARTRPRLSASAIETFKACPLSFYLQYVMGVRSTDEMTSYVGSAQQGTIVHRSIQSLFDSERGEHGSAVITRSCYDRWLNPESDIPEQTVGRVLSAERHGGNESSAHDLEEEILIGQIAQTVRCDLEAEREYYCSGSQAFTYIGSEMRFDRDPDGNEAERWSIGDGLTVRFTMSVDRVDRLSDGTLRFVDFKTGTDKTTLPSPDDLLNPSKSDFDGVLQLLIYCDAYLDRIDPNARIIPVIHNMRDVAKGEGIRYIVPDGDHTYNSIREAYAPVIHGLVRRIFDRDEEICQAEDDKACTFCDFKAICGRYPKEW